MVYRLDPAVPLVWRDPHTLQLGVDRVVCVFPRVSAATERMLAALRTGAARSALEVEAGARPDAATEVSALLASVSDALEPAETAEPRSRVAVDGTGPTAERLVRLLREAGHHVVFADRGADDGTIRAAVIVASRVVPPWRHGTWLRQDIPHLPIVFGDDGAEVGPFVDADGPCLRCLSLHRRDLDPAWPAIATQLDAHSPAPEPTVLSAHVAAIAAHWVENRVRAGDRSRSATSTRVHPDGSLTEQEHSPHALCGCRVLPENVTALAGRQHSPTSSGQVGASHG